MAVAKFALTYKDIVFLAVSPSFVRSIQGRKSLGLYAYPLALTLRSTAEEEVKARYEIMNARIRANIPDWPENMKQWRSLCENKWHYLTRSPWINQVASCVVTERTALWASSARDSL